MSIPDDPAELRRKLVATLGSVPRHAHHAMMFNFFAVAKRVGFENLFPRVCIVADSNQVLAFLRAKALGRSHPLDELLVDHYAYFAAPLSLISEVERKIPLIAAEQRLNASLMWQVWRERIRPVIDFRSRFAQAAWFDAQLALGDRDPSDIPFLAAYLDLGADALLTSDNDLRDIVTDFAWTPGRARWAVIRVKTGVVALYAIHPLGTTAGRILAYLLWTLLDSLLWLISSALDALARGIVAVIEWVSKLPGWLQAVIVGGGVLAWLKYRNEIVAKWQQLKEAFARGVGAVRGFLQRAVEWLRKWLRVTADLLLLLLDDVVAGANELVAARYGARWSGSAPRRYPTYR